MTQVTFYQLAADSESSQPAHMQMACELAAACFRNKQRCLVLCENKQAAEQFDELLWQLPAQGFIPHNLSGEGPSAGAPVEIAWQMPARANRQVLINLACAMPEQFQRYQQVYDFAPAAEEQKQQARIRFKQYRAAGSLPQFVPVGSSNESNDG